MDRAQYDEALRLHKRARGKVQTFPTVTIRNERQLATAYVPGCSAASAEITKSPETAYDLTGKANRIAEISNATGVFGMGRTCPEAALPVLEGKCLLLKSMGDINAYPLSIDAPEASDVVRFCRTIAPSFGGINIEDVASPDSFTVLRELSADIGIPVFCDDQHGSAIVVLSAVKNSLTILEKPISDAKIVVLGTGNAGIATTELLLAAGARDVIVVGPGGIIDGSGDDIVREIAARTDPRGVRGGLDEAIAGADLLIGLSNGVKVTKDQIRKMSHKPVILSLALPEPEISSAEAREAGAFIYASGLMDDVNTVLNVQAFPGLVRGALDIRAKRITPSMLLAAADALANMVDRRHLSPDRICPRFFGGERTPRIAEAVAQAAMNDGVAAVTVTNGTVYENTWHRLFGDGAAL